MKKIYFILIFLPLLLTGCGSAGRDSVIRNSSKECVSPSNPYNDGGGHDAGFNWAEENSVGSCGGNSDSFIEGCEEYLRQQSTYENCINN